MIEMVEDEPEMADGVLDGDSLTESEKQEIFDEAQRNISDADSAEEEGFGRFIPSFSRPEWTKFGDNKEE